MRIIRDRLVLYAAVLSLALGAATLGPELAAQETGKSGAMQAALTVAGMPLEQGEAAGQGAAPSWGTSSESVLNVNAWAFDHYDPSAVVESWVAGGRYISSGSTEWLASASLPTGALVTGLEIQGCDNSASGELLVQLVRNYISGGTEHLSLVGGAFLHTGIAATPGCGNFVQALSPETISNAGQSYLVDVQHNSVFDGSVRFQAVLIHYKLQVSPAPSVATFNDVPTSHQYFQFIEALKASGITTGCQVSPPLYCPDNPVTRGQMAVFLARALGLHWPN